MRRIYAASRTRHAVMWKHLRGIGWPIISSWIDEAGEGQTDDLSELWERIEREVTTADRLVLYVEPDDFPLKGAFIEAGMAIAAKVPVMIYAPGVTLEPRSLRPLGSWAKHPLVSFADAMSDALMGIALPEATREREAGS